MALRSLAGSWTRTSRKRNILSQLISAEPRLELLVHPNINIVCFRFRADGQSEEERKALNIEIMLRLQEQGIAALSDTMVHASIACARRSTIIGRNPPIS